MILKDWIKEIINRSGYRVVKRNPFPPASPNRPPYSNFASIFEDIVARGFRTDAIMDVGANNAGWSENAKVFFPKAEFYLIEPQTEMENSLISFCERYPASKYFLVGAGSENQKLSFTVWDDKAGSSFIPKLNQTYNYASEKREIEVIMINSLIRNENLKIPNLVKLDVQGYEIEALKGASDLFGKTEVFIMEVAFFKFEGMPTFHEVIDFMNSHGYVVYDFAGFSRRPYDGALGQCDIVFLKKKSKLISYQNWR